jgi:Amino acid kinase family
VPPYSLWEHPPKLGKIAPNRTDVGVYLLAEVYGAASVLYVKDVDGVYTADPKLDPAATRIPRARVSELQQMGLVTLPVDRLVLELMLPTTAGRCRSSTEPLRACSHALLTANRWEPSSRRTVREPRVREAARAQAAATEDATAGA